MRKYTLTLPANSQGQIDAVGDFVRVVSGSDFLIGAHMGAVQIEAEANKTVKLLPFTSLQISDLSGAENVVVLEVGSGSIDVTTLSAVVTLAAAVSLVPDSEIKINSEFKEAFYTDARVEVHGGRNIKSPADKVLAADAPDILYGQQLDRACLMIQSDIANAVPVRIHNPGDPGGIHIMPGETMRLEASYAPWGEALGGTARLRFFESYS